MRRTLATATFVLLALGGSAQTIFGQHTPSDGTTRSPQAELTGKTRTYYVAADEVNWDYAPGGVNKMMGMKFEGHSKIFTDRGPHLIGSVYRKALYRC